MSSTVYQHGLNLEDFSQSPVGFSITDFSRNCPFGKDFYTCLMQIFLKSDLVLNCSHDALTPGAPEVQAEFCICRISKLKYLECPCSQYQAMNWVGSCLACFVQVLSAFTCQIKVLMHVTQSVNE